MLFQVFSSSTSNENDLNIEVEIAPSVSFGIWTSKIGTKTTGLIWILFVSSSGASATKLLKAVFNS
jgi:hypothetical protein